jgi:glycosyltransferase involved in cell wall biosynthesis
MDALQIGIITSQYYPRLGGMEHATYFLANALNDCTEITASVACSNMPEVPKNYTYSHPVYRSQKFWYLTPYLQRKNISNMLKHEKINVIQGQTLNGGGFTALPFSKKNNIPLVVTSHGSDVQVVEEIGYGECLNLQQKQKVITVLEQADKIIAVSSNNKFDILNLGCNEQKVSVIPNGILFSDIQAIPYKDIRSEYGITDDDFVIITVGRNSKVKRMKLLFQALSKLKNKHIKCLCIGPDKELIKLANEFNLSEQLILIGRIPENPYLENPPYPELINLYRAANLYVSVSYVESFGMAGADSLACGIPVLCCKNHGIKDVLIENSSGYILENNTAESLAVYLDFLYNKKEELKSEKDQIISSVAHLDWKNIAKEYVVIYSKL